ncbi:MAG: sigma-70 family RNA polymerase sigma factor [Burkholderiaceae bacterium]
MKPADTGPNSGLAELPDEDLMLLVARGLIQEPATELFARHNRALFNFLAWLCDGRLDEAEDLAQKTWFKLISRCADYQPGRAAFRTYLFQIARNGFIDARRAAGERLREDIDVDEALARSGQGGAAGHATGHGPDRGVVEPEAALLAGESRQLLHAALMALPVAQREVIVLRYFADLSLEDVSTTVGAGIETVRSRLRYAYRALRGRLEASR